MKRSRSFLKKIILLGICIFAIVVLLHPNLNARGTYDHIKKEDILHHMHYEVAANLSSSATVSCDYRDIIYDDDTTLSPSLIDGDLVEGYRILEGGEYHPADCKPKFSTAIIVPFRDRAEQLRGFLVYMHIFLRKQRIHYRIFVIEQVDRQPFNRAKLLNVGAKAAIKAGFPCLVLHDVDLLPLRPANLYACTTQPRHMSSCINKFRFVLPYLTLFGGAIAIVAKQFVAVNGMSNEYFGWGGEDDDLYARLESHHFILWRFEPSTSLYHMIYHKLQEKGQREKTKKLLSEARERMDIDGLSTLSYTEVVTVLHPLFTHIVVEL